MENLKHYFDCLHSANIFFYEITGMYKRIYFLEKVKVSILASIHKNFLIFSLTNLEFVLYTMKIKFFEGRKEMMIARILCLEGGIRLFDTKNRLILAIFVCAFVFYALSGAQETAWFCQPYGTVEYRGDLAPGGSEVVAFIEGQKFASCLTNKDGEYNLLISKDDPVTPNKEGWAEEDIITIKVNGFSANPRFKAFAGAQKIDLSVSTLDVKLTTWGKIKALFR